MRKNGMKLWEIKVPEQIVRIESREILTAVNHIGDFLKGTTYKEVEE